MTIIYDRAKNRNHSLLIVDVKGEERVEVMNNKEHKIIDDPKKDPISVTRVLIALTLRLLKTSCRQLQDTLTRKETKDFQWIFAIPQHDY